MKFKIQKNVLDKSLDKVVNIIDPSNLFFPVLTGINIELKENGLSLIGSNGNTSIKSEILSSDIEEIERLGKALIPTTIFKNIVKKLKGLITLEIENNILNIFNNNDNFSINLLQYDDYPNIDFTQYGDKITLKAELFREMTKNTIFAAASGEHANKMWSAVNISAKNNKLTFIASDTSRISSQTEEIESDVEFEVSVYAKNLKDFLPQDINGELEIFIEDSKINTKFDNTIIQTKILDSPYSPNVKTAFPKQDDLISFVTITKKEITDLLSKATIINAENNNEIEISILENEMIIKSVRAETGVIKVSTQDFSLSGEEVNFKINSKFLKDAISVFEEDIVLATSSKSGFVEKILIFSKHKKSIKELIAPIRG